MKKKTLKGQVAANRLANGVESAPITGHTQSNQRAFHMCDNCGHAVTVEDHAATRKSSEVAAIELAGKRDDLDELIARLDKMDVRELGILCANCGWWFHSLFDDKRMKNPRAKMLDAGRLLKIQPHNKGRQVRFVKAKKRCGATMEAINLEWRPVFGRKSPSEQVAVFNDG